MGQAVILFCIEGAAGRSPIKTTDRFADATRRAIRRRSHQTKNRQASPAPPPRSEPLRNDRKSKFDKRRTPAQGSPGRGSTSRKISKRFQGASGGCTPRLGT